MALIRTLPVSTIAFERKKEELHGFRQTEYSANREVGAKVSHWLRTRETRRSILTRGTLTNFFFFWGGGGDSLQSSFGVTIFEINF